jgi:hypothetical protein
VPTTQHDQHRAGSFWRRLDEGERAAITDAAKSRWFRRGDALMHAADTGTWLAVLDRGRVHVVDATGARVLATR